MTLRRRCTCPEDPHGQKSDNCSDTENGRAFIPVRSMLVLVTASLLGTAVGGLAYLIHQDPAVAIIAGGVAFRDAFGPLNSAIG